LLAILLAACTQSPPKPPPAPPPPAKPAAATPAKPAAATPTPPRADEPRRIDAENFARERDRLAATLGRDERAALADTEVGYYMDVLQGRLLQRAGDRLTVTRESDRLIVALNGAFESAGDRCQPARPLGEALQALAKVLAEFDKTLVALRVEADVRGAALDPVQAHRYAVAAARSLEQAGVAGRRLAVVERGAAAKAPASAGAATTTAHVEVDIDPIRRRAGN
jgi:hypothetical protein